MYHRPLPVCRRSADSTQERPDELDNRRLTVEAIHVAGVSDDVAFGAELSHQRVVVVELFLVASVAQYRHLKPVVVRPPCR
jgi:hypothetical protein